MGEAKNSFICLIKAQSLRTINMGSNVTKFMNGPAKLCCKNTEPPVAEGSPVPDDGAGGGKSVEPRPSQSKFGTENLRPTSRSPSFKTFPSDGEKSQRSISISRSERKMSGSP